MFKRILQALNDNAQLIHDYHCDPKQYTEVKEPIHAYVVCTHCGYRSNIDDDTHVCTSMEIPK